MVFSMRSLAKGPNIALRAIHSSKYLHPDYRTLRLVMGAQVIPSREVNITYAPLQNISLCLCLKAVINRQISGLAYQIFTQECSSPFYDVLSICGQQLPPLKYIADRNYNCEDFCDEKSFSNTKKDKTRIQDLLNLFF